MGNGKYVLDADGNVREAELMEWAMWFEDADNRRVAYTKFDDGTEVSTVFLGLDHSFGDGPPVLWETMAFGPRANDIQERYTSREDAQAGHDRIVAELSAP